LSRRTDGAPKNEIDPRVLAELGSLSLKARMLADSALHGMHRSRHHGSSVEFAEHKEYSPGDNVRHLDWRAYARFDRHYIKRFEDEANLRALMLIDTSGSMGYRSPVEGRPTKLELSVVGAAALSYVLARQGDAVGLGTFATGLELRVPPRARRGHLQEIFVNLESLGASGTTALGKALDRLAEGMNRRMVLVIFSDLLEAGEDAMRAVSRIAARRHDVALFHVMDPDELDFPFEDNTLFTSLEDGREVPIDARAIKKAYLDEVAQFLRGVERQARSAQVEYHLVRTDVSPSGLLGRFLANRASSRHSAR